MKEKTKIVPLLIIVVCCVIEAYQANKIFNGNFEQCIDTCPTGWEFENFASCRNIFTPVFENGQTHRIDWFNLTTKPYEGEKFLVLSTGDIGADSETSYGRVTQQIELQAGDVFRGAYLFGTGDYYGWNDYANILLTPTDPNSSLRQIILVDISVQDIGDYRSTESWQVFETQILPAQAGEYYIDCGVFDRNDMIFKSYLMLDGFYCGRDGMAGDFDGNCTINFLDIAHFSQIYGTDCNDPNTNCTYTDCTGEVHSYDLNNDLVIEINDLEPAVVNWLWDIEE